MTPLLTRHPNETDVDFAERCALRAWGEASDRLPEYAALRAAEKAEAVARAALEVTPEYAALVAAQEAVRQASLAFQKASDQLSEYAVWEAAARKSDEEMAQRAEWREQ